MPPMKRTCLPACSLIVGWLLVLAPVGADEAKPVIKVGGNFEVEAVKDIAYHEGPEADPDKHKLDLYLPRGQRDFPVLFFVHGGSWRSGDRKLYAPLGNVFARNGVGTVIISYRLSPQVVHPGHIRDVAKAFAWTCGNIGKHGGKADQLFVCGHSAGGHLAALLATDESYLKAEKRSLSSIRGTIPISGVYSISANRFFEHAFGKDAEAARGASPQVHVKEKLCPFCIIYAEKEYPFLDTMAEQFSKALLKCKCETSLLRVPDRHHESIIVKAAGDEADPTTQTILEFIARHSDLKLKPRQEK
jgi:acetyl esterase/lipase